MSFFKKVRAAILPTFTLPKVPSASPSSINIDQVYSSNDTPARHVKQQKDSKKICNESLNAPTQEDYNIPAASSANVQEIEHERPLSEKFTQTTTLGGFYNLVPHEILYVIFEHLEYMDLLFCTAVCQQWRDFLLEWPGFWKIMSDKLPSVDRPMLISLLTWNTAAVHFEGITDVTTLRDVFSYLCMLKKSNFIQRISVKNMDLTTDMVRSLGNAMKSVSPSLKQLDLIYCDKMPRQDLFEYVFPVCSSNLTHASFNLLYQPSNAYYSAPRPKLRIKLKWIPENQCVLQQPTTKLYSALTYLKLVGFPHEDRYDGSVRNRRYSVLNLNMTVPTFFSQCPNLVHLFLDAHTTLHRYYEAGYHHAAELCPRLKTLVVSDDAIMPQTMLTHGIAVIDSAVDHHNETTKAGLEASGSLRYFALTGRSKSKDEIHLIPLFQKHHITLQLLHLDFDGLGVTPAALKSLVSYGGCPHLREFRLSSLNCKKYDKSKTKSTTVVSGDLLAELFSVCPALEAIKIVEGCFALEYTRFLNVTPLVLKTIARKCPRLSQLYISGHPDYPIYRTHPPDRVDTTSSVKGYSGKDFLCFANNTPNVTCDKTAQQNNILLEKENDKAMRDNDHNTRKLESLTVHEMEVKTAYTLVNNIGSLKHLHILRWSTINSNKNEELIDPIKNILESRNGSLILS